MAIQVITHVRYYTSNGMEYYVLLLKYTTTVITV